MIRSILILVAGALLLSGCSAPDPLEDHDWPAASPALWEVTSPGGETGWLFGTVHALPASLDWQSGAVDTAFAASGLLVVEIAELGEASSGPSLFAELAASSGLAPLLERVPPEDRPALQTLIESAGADADDFADMETWAAAIILSGSMRSGDPDHGVDRELLGRAGKIAGLEGYSRQYAVFDGLPEEEQADLLMAIASEARAYDPVTSLEAWMTGDMARLEELASTGILADPELRSALLTDRNLNWLAAIAAFIEGGNKPFVAVGAAHMLGETGLPALLTAEGYQVRRIQ